jgi:hypothetical protein
VIAAAPLLLALATQDPASQPAVDVRALVDRVVTAYGGPRALKKLDAYRIEGRLSGEAADVPGHDHDGEHANKALPADRRVQRDFAAPDRMRIEVRHGTRTELRLLDGARGWRSTGDKQQEVRGFHGQAMQAQLLRATAPWALVHYRDQLTAEDRRERDGKPHQVLRYRRGDLRVDYWVELGSARVTRVETIQGEGAMQLHFATSLEDFRKVDGVLVPHLEHNFVRGNQAGTTHVERVRFGVKGLGPFSPGEPSSTPAASRPALP